MRVRPLATYSELTALLLTLATSQVTTGTTRRGSGLRPARLNPTMRTDAYPDG